MNNVTRLERQIAKTLGVTPNGLDVLRRLKRGDNISGNNTGTMLDNLGLTELVQIPREISHLGYYPKRVITDKGREVLQRARDMGF